MVGVAVHRETGQKVVFGVDETTGACVLQFWQPLAQFDSPREPAPPEIVVDRFIALPTEQPHLNLAAAIDIPLGEPLAVRTHDCRQVAVQDLCGDLSDRAAENPGMTLARRFVTAGF